MAMDRPDFANVLYTFPSPASVSEALDTLIARISSESIARSGRFTIAISGGSLPKTLAAVLKHNTNIEFAKWHVVYADERCVPLEDADSNHLATHTELLAHVGVPASQVYTIAPHLIANPDAAAKDYEAKLVAATLATASGDTPRIDAVLLGMGPDGHTCSLFPNHPLLTESTRFVAPITDSPKPPPCRITLTLPVVNAARNVVFVTTGVGKADIFHSMVDLGQDYPSARVCPRDGNLYWFLDQPAASKLTTPTRTFKL